MLSNPHIKEYKLAVWNIPTLINHTTRIFFHPIFGNNAEVKFTSPQIRNLLSIFYRTFIHEQTRWVRMVKEASVLLHCPVTDKIKFRKGNCEWDWVDWKNITLRHLLKNFKGNHCVRWLRWIRIQSEWTAYSADMSQLTFWSLTTYIYMSYRSANLQTLHFKYLFNNYTYWIF